MIQLLIGDCNLPDVEWSSEFLKTSCVYNTGISYRMLEILRDNYNSQVNFQPTRDKNVFDLVFVSNPDLVKEMHTSPGMSDHDSIIADTVTKAKINNKKSRTVHVYGKANWTNLKSDLYSLQQEFISSDPQDESLEENWVAFKSAISNAIKLHISQKQLNGQWNLPYMTGDIKFKIRTKVRRNKKARKTGKN